MHQAIELFKLMRPQQWYKNVLVFIAVFFTGQLFNFPVVFLSVLGFIALCLISSANYILNDLLDIKEDRKHPEKRNRPLVAGKLKISNVILLWAFCMIGAFTIAITLPGNFYLIILLLFASTTAYSVWLKHEVFLDVIMIGVNFVLRAVSGTLLINAEISPWLIICAFFLALFMGFGKRMADLDILGAKAKEHKKVYKYYTKELLNIIIGTTVATLLISYAFYTFSTIHPFLMVTLPVVVYGLYRYLYLIYSGSGIARHPEKIIEDIRLVSAMMLWGLAIFVLIYF